MSREPFTKAGRRLWDYAHGISRLETPGARSGALNIMRRDILAIEDELINLYACGHLVLGGTCDRPRGHAGAHEKNVRSIGEAGE